MKYLTKKEAAFFGYFLFFGIVLALGYVHVADNQGKAVSVSVPYPPQQPGECNRAALKTMILALGPSKNPGLYNYYLSIVDTTCTPAVNWSDIFDKLDPNVPSKGQWVTYYNIDAYANDRTATNGLKNNILGSLIDRRGVIVGNGLFNSDTSPGHFYFITGYDCASGKYTLTDGRHGGNNHFQAGDGSLSNILNQGTNDNIMVNGNGDNALMILFLPAKNSYNFPGVKPPPQLKQRPAAQASGTPNALAVVTASPTPLPCFSDIQLPAVPLESPTPTPQSSSTPSPRISPTSTPTASPAPTASSSTAPKR